MFCTLSWCFQCSALCLSVTEEYHHINLGPDPHISYIPTMATFDQHVAALTQAVYLDFETRFHDPDFIIKRTVLAPANLCVNAMNAFLTGKLPGKSMELTGCDTLIDTDGGAFFPPEFLNSINMGTLPPASTHPLPEGWHACNAALESQPSEWTVTLRRIKAK